MKKVSVTSENVMLLEKEFIKGFKKIRKENSYTQASLALKTNMVRETIARIESGVVSPQISTIIKLLEPIGYTLEFKKIETEEEEQQNANEKETIK